MSHRHDSVNHRHDDDERLLAAIDLELARRAVAGGHRAPRDLRRRVLDTADADRCEDDAATAADTPQIWRRWREERPPGSAPRLATVRSSSADWEPTSIPGIRTRRLAVDAERRSVTMMVEMAPGTRYPAHRHGGAEECFVLSGDLRIGEEEVLAAGDYQRADAGSFHPVQSTDGGCTLLLVSSQDDELTG